MRLVVLRCCVLAGLALLASAQPTYKGVQHLELDHTGVLIVGGSTQDGQFLPSLTGGKFFIASPHENAAGKTQGCAQVIAQDSDETSQQEANGLDKNLFRRGAFFNPTNQSFLVLNFTLGGPPSERLNALNSMANLTNCKARAWIWTNNIDRLPTRDENEFEADKYQWPSEVVGFPSDLGRHLQGDILNDGNETTAIFSILKINRQLTDGVGFFEISLECDTGNPVMFCIFYENKRADFPPIFGLVIAGALLAIVFAAILWLVGAFFERGMEEEFKSRTRGPITKGEIDERDAAAQKIADHETSGN